MSNDDYRPSHVEIDQAKEESNISAILSKLLKNERAVAKNWERLGKNMQNSLSLVREYKQHMFESSRNYIQMINQKSEIIQNKDLNVIKEHIRRLEENMKNQQPMIEAILSMGGAYNDYIQNLAKTESAWSQISGYGEEWHVTNNKLTKALSESRAHKMGKLEKKMIESRDGLMKAYETKAREHEQLSANYLKLNKAWQILKASIKGIQW